MEVVAKVGKQHTWTFGIILIVFPHLEKGMETAGMGFVPACIHVLNSLKFRLLPKKCQTGKL
jgi:hypothetical protein